MFRTAVAASVLVPILVVLCGTPALAQSKPEPASPSTALAKFAGTWKEDLSKRKGELLTLTFRRGASVALEELRGSELRPLVQPVNFTGKPYAIDGSQNTIAWKQIDANRFERELYSAGRLLNTRRIQLSADGTTLTQETESIGPAGQKTVETTVFRRASGDKGLVGLWRPVSSKSSTPPEIIYELVASNGLKLTTRGIAPSTVTAMLDNKPVAIVGDSVISGTMSAVRQVDGSTLEFTTSREGTVTGRSHRVVSPDGKTMTVTTTQLGPNASKEPQVSVFVKQ